MMESGNMPSGASGPGSSSDLLPARSYQEYCNLAFLSELCARGILLHADIQAYLESDSCGDANINLMQLSPDALYSLLQVRIKKREKLQALLEQPGCIPGLLQRIEIALRRGIFMLTDSDCLYPALLREVRTKPAILWAAGEMAEEALQAPMVTIIGTRKATPYGLRAAADFSRALAVRGICVVSGMALGIDGEAHRAALNADGLTAAVLASGVDHCYPPEHIGLYRQIWDKGVILSEYPPGVLPRPSSFPVRNRLLAGLSQGTIVAEATERSGTLITVEYCGQMGRDVYAIPGNIFSPESRGPNKLLFEGAIPLTGTSDLDHYIHGLRNTGISKIDISSAANPVQREILRLLAAQPLAADELLAAGNWSASVLFDNLADLEGRFAIQPFRGRYVLTSRN